MPWDFALILFLLGVVLPWRGARRVRLLLSLPAVGTAERLAVYATTTALQWLAAGIVLWRCLARGVSFEDLALALPDPLRAAALLVIPIPVFLLVQEFSLRRLATLPPDEQGVIGALARKILPQHAAERLAFAALAATVSICEEILYRGFVFHVFAEWSGSAWIAAAASAALFAVAHLYQGSRGIASTFAAGLVFAALREMSGSLVPCIGLHLAVDLYAGFVAPRKLGRAAAGVAA